MNGVRGLTAQDVGVYTMVLCRIYEENGPVEYHPFRLATYCGMRELSFKKAVMKLVELGKLTLVGGMLSNARAEVEIQKRADGLKMASKAGKASAEKRKQNQQISATDVQQPFNHTDTDTDKKEDGGGGSAREAKNLPVEVLLRTTRERILEAIGVDQVSGLTGQGGRMLGTQADMAEVTRWLDLPGITEPIMLAEVQRIIANKRDGPPSSFKFFTAAMQRLSGQLTQAPLDPITSPPPTGGRYDNRAFGAAANQLARDLSAGIVQLDNSSRDPFAPRSGGNFAPGERDPVHARLLPGAE